MSFGPKNIFIKYKYDKPFTATTTKYPKWIKRQPLLHLFLCINYVFRISENKYDEDHSFVYYASADII